MPLVKGSSRAAIGKNIGIEMKHKPKAQAVAIAMSTARSAAKKAGRRVGYLARPTGKY